MFRLFLTLGIGFLFIALVLQWGTPRRTAREQASIWNLLYAPSSLDGLSALLDQNEKETGISADLVRAVIFAESGFNPRATSVRGARGLMQVMPSTARAQGFVPSYEVEENVAAGVSYLAAMMKRFDGDIPLALAAYNAGPGAVEKHRGIPPYRETQRYVAKVMSLYQFFKGNPE